MDRKSIAAIVVCFLAFWGWDYYLNKKYPQRHQRQNPPPAAEAPAPEHSMSSQPAGSDATAALSNAPAEKVSLLAESALTIETKTSVYTFDQQTGGLKSLVLKDFESDTRDSRINIVPRGLRLRGGQDDSSLQALLGPVAARRDGDSLTFSYQEGPWAIEHRLTPSPDTYGADLAVTWRNIGNSSLELNPSVALTEDIPHAAQGSSFFPGMPSARPGIMAAIGDSLERRDVHEYCDKGKDSEEPLAGRMQELAYFGFDKHYFLKVLLPQSKKISYRTVVAKRIPAESCVISLWTSLPQGQVQPGQSVTLNYRAWFGPKDGELMGAYNVKLEDSLDLGFFSKICHPLLAALKMAHGWVGNWGVAIIILTIFLKMLFYPLMRQSAVAQRRMKKLQPELERLKEKYKDDQRMLNQETMRFMAANKVNPMKGCLPILPTIPVFFAFYRVLSSSIELRHAPFAAWITDLSAHDPYYVTPLVYGALTLVQQKLTPMTGMDKSQERIMMMLPIMFTFFMLKLPAGLVLYMLTNTIVSIAQQQWLNKRLA